MPTNKYPMPTVLSGPLNPTGTSSTTYVMMGMGVTFTPELTGAVLIIMVGQVANSTAGDGAELQPKTGTGTAPGNGVASTGTTQGTTLNWAKLPSTGITFLVWAYATGLTPGTQYWCDAALEAETAGTATISGVYVIVIEFGAPTI